MSNTKGSKSAPTRKPKMPSKGGAPEVTLDNGTTAVLPNPADAPAPPRGGRKRKTEPTVATRPEPTPPAEVPEWVKRAAARDSVAEMAAVPEITAPLAPAPEAPAPKRIRRRPPKAARPKPAATAASKAAPGSLRAIGDAWLESLQAAGHTPATVSSYGNDLGIAYEHFGEVKAAEITEKGIAAFNTSKGVVKTRTGKAKAQPTILKTRRALRLALTWAEEKSLIKKAPIPAA